MNRDIYTATTNMTSTNSSKEWLERNIADESIRFYAFDDLIDSVYVGSGGYGVVFRAKVKSSGVTVAYKFLHSYEHAMFDDFVKEVSIKVSENKRIEQFLLTKVIQLNFSLKYIVRSMTILTLFDSLG